MTTDDDELDDASMKSMRAVWLTMRDEEPPSSGMSALLAAAREKAEQMSAKPSWFERTFGFLRRPPALAFATVMILIGGAVLVTKNTADTKTDAEMSNAAPTMPEPPERSRDDFARQPQMAPAGPESTLLPTPATIDPHAGMGSGAEASSPPLESPPPETPTVKAKPKSQPKDLGKPPDATRDAKAQRPTGKTIDDLTDKPVKVELGSVREDSVGGVVQGRGEGQKIGTDTAAPSIDSNAPPPQPEPPQHKRPAVKESGDEADQVTVTNTKKPTTPPVEQLKNQAESAASHGDCTAVKVIVARIKKQDASYYKTRVATNTTIKKCL